MIIKTKVGVPCPSCKCLGSKVLDSRLARGGYTKRRRKCNTCGVKWTTAEIFFSQDLRRRAQPESPTFTDEGFLDLGFVVLWSDVTVLAAVAPLPEPEQPLDLLPPDVLDPARSPEARSVLPGS